MLYLQTSFFLRPVFSYFFLGILVWFFFASLNHTKCNICTSEKWIHVSSIKNQARKKARKLHRIIFPNFFSNFFSLNNTLKIHTFRVVWFLKGQLYMCTYIYSKLLSRKLCVHNFFILFDFIQHHAHLQWHKMNVLFETDMTDGGEWKKSHVCLSPYITNYSTPLYSLFLI